MESVAKQIEEVSKSAESMDAAKLEKIGTASLGDVVRQGDLYLVCLGDMPEGAESKERQLAPGSTQGSRHIAKGRCRILVPKDRSSVAELIARVVRGAAIPDELVGPVIRCVGDVTIEHPEHGHKCLPKGSMWAVVYQRALAKEIRRVQD